jgi:hypothetical protein
MNKASVFVWLLGVSVGFASAAAFAQGEKAKPEVPVNLKTLVLKNDTKLNDIELLLNKILAAQVIVEEDVKKLEEGLSGYLDGMHQALIAPQGLSPKKEALVVRTVVMNELKLFEDMVRLHEAKWRSLDQVHTAIMAKILKADIALDEAWLNKMGQEEREDHYRSLTPAGRQKMKSLHPQLFHEP